MLLARNPPAVVVHILSGYFTCDMYVTHTHTHIYIYILYTYIVIHVHTHISIFLIQQVFMHKKSESVATANQMCIFNHIYTCMCVGHNTPAHPAHIFYNILT